MFVNKSFFGTCFDYIDLFGVEMCRYSVFFIKICRNKKITFILNHHLSFLLPHPLTAPHIFYAIYSLRETVQIISIFEFPNWFWIYKVWKVLFGWDKVDIDRSLVLFLVFWFNYFLERELSIIWRQKIGFSEDPINSPPPPSFLRFLLNYYTSLWDSPAPFSTHL